MALFNLRPTTLSSGRPSSWIIDCTALTKDDWAWAAAEIARWSGEFSSVEGVPQGGLCLAEALKPYTSARGPLLIVDDVLTTGESMTAHRGKRVAYGYVLFDRSRGARPHWIQALWTLD